VPVLVPGAAVSPAEAPAVHPSRNKRLKQAVVSGELLKNPEPAINPVRVEADLGVRIGHIPRREGAPPSLARVGISRAQSRRVVGFFVRCGFRRMDPGRYLPTCARYLEREASRMASPKLHGVTIFIIEEQMRRLCGQCEKGWPRRAAGVNT